MTSPEFKRWLAKQGCACEPGRGGHLTVRLGDKVTDLPMHGNKRDLPTGTVNGIKKAARPEVAERGMRYPITLTPDDGQFTVTFPDVPEAVTFGETREEALQRAPDALLTIFDAFIADRRDIPEPSVRKGEAIELPALDCAKIELYRAMRESNVGKAELGRRLDWHPPQVDRLLDVRHQSHLGQLEAAFAALGKQVEIVVSDAPVRARAHGRPRGHAGARRVGRTVVRRAVKRR